MNSLNRKKTKLFTIHFSTAGMVSILIFVGSLLFLAAGLAIAFRTYGHGDATIAALGFLAFFLNILGLIFPIRDARKRAKEEGMPVLSKVAIGLNLAGIAGIITIYVMGIII
ncbi:DUF6142 family protein [Qiania dongpingensis]|uniref:Uncharacterized protein n=1 Tax=Qiania dongpingensis TaxID=2763669 RepID=A0A7G9G6E7_9FIRM|nr:DUF6142 family protein [Qiania dongpingensis]QNM06379.1 hypothetical protein H9Q78_04380 [Qiania dongpingensis]